MNEWKEAKESELVCYCQQVDKGTIVDSIRRGNVSLNQIKEDTTACTGGKCKVLNPSGKCCSGDILKLIDLYTAGKPVPPDDCSCCRS